MRALVDFIVLRIGTSGMAPVLVLEVEAKKNARY